MISERLAGISQEKIALEAERTAKSRAGQEMNETLLNLERAAGKLETEADHLRHGGKADPGQAVGDTTS